MGPCWAVCHAQPMRRCCGRPATLRPYSAAAERRPVALRPTLSVWFALSKRSRDLRTTTKTRGKSDAMCGGTTQGDRNVLIRHGGRVWRRSPGRAGRQRGRTQAAGGQAADSAKTAGRVIEIMLRVSCGCHRRCRSGSLRRDAPRLWSMRVLSCRGARTSSVLHLHAIHVRPRGNAPWYGGHQTLEAESDERECARGVPPRCCKIHRRPTRGRIPSRHD
jgi:hypothetical protein